MSKRYEPEHVTVMGWLVRTQILAAYLMIRGGKMAVVS